MPTLTPEDENWRPQLGAALKSYMEQAVKRLPKRDPARKWNTTQAARYFLARGIMAATGQDIPPDVAGMLKEFDKDF